MNFPALAKRTYDQFREDPNLKGVLKRVLKKLRSMGNPMRRARWVHRQVSEALLRLFENRIIEENISCTKGCDACCHTQVSVTEDEAYLLASLVKQGVSIDRERLKKQATAGNSSKNWYELSYKDRRCVFLNEKNQCSIYKSRPSVCRTNYVFSNPADCSTEDGVEKPIRILNTHEADMVIMASFMSCRDNGALPVMLAKALNIRVKSGQVDKKVFPRQKDL